MLLPRKVALSRLGHALPKGRRRCLSLCRRLRVCRREKLDRKAAEESSRRAGAIMDEARHLMHLKRETRQQKTDLARKDDRERVSQMIDNAAQSRKNDAASG